MFGHAGRWLSLGLGLGVIGAATAAADKEAPTLLSPEAGAQIAQNDPAADCAPAAHGHRLDLDWADVGGPVEGYDVWVRRGGAKYPDVDEFVTTPYLRKAVCGFVVDLYLDLWEWRVRARFRGGRTGPWSESRTFRFAPCRLENGQECGGRRLAGDDGELPPSRRGMPSQLVLVRRGDKPPADATVLATPWQLGPRDAAVLDRRQPALLSWRPVADASAYLVEASCTACCKDDPWCSEPQAADQLEQRVTAPRFVLPWRGARSGRWRVRSLGANGQASSVSPWWSFRFKSE
jgi:hypothetical protein